MDSPSAETRSGPGSIERRRTVPGVPPPTGPYAYTVTHGDLVFVSGLCGIDPATGKPAETDERRVSLIFSHLAKILKASGSSLSRILSTRVYVTDMARHRPLVNEAYERFFGTELPTRTIVEISALNLSDTIEIEVVAVKEWPSSKGR